MNKIALLLVAIVTTSMLPRVAAQTEVERLKKEVDELKALVQAQAVQIEELNDRVDTSLEEELKDRIADIVAEKSKFYARPDGRRGSNTKNAFIFDALEGGLIFTGLFRTRFEWRASNVDFNDGGSGIDDRGTRFNGRFRLGFGAVILKGGPTDPEVSALTEFQATGTLANNTFFSFTGPGGVPLPTEFTIFKEPFEQVGIYQGYLSFDRVLAEDVYLRLGRQEVILPGPESNASEFLFGNNSFYDGTVHDGVVVTWERPSFSLSGFYLKEAQSDTELAVTFPADDFDEDWLAGAYFSFRPNDDESAAIDAYALFFDGRSNFTDSFVTRSTASAFDGALTPAILGHFWTLGGRVFWSDIDFFGGELQINAEAAYQTGNNGLDPAVSGGLDEQSIHGWSAELLLNWWIDPFSELSPIVSLSYYYAGGGSPNGNTANGSPNSHIGFQPLFINRHFDTPARQRTELNRVYHAGGGRYGNMDLIPLSNIHIVKAATTIAASENSEIGIAGLMAITADDEGWGTGIFGYEIDVFGTYDYSKYIRFSANISAFFPQRTASDMADYFFFSGTGLDGRADDDIAFAVYVQALIAF